MKVALDLMTQEKPNHFNLSLVTRPLVLKTHAIIVVFQVTSEVLLACPTTKMFSVGLHLSITLIY